MFVNLLERWTANINLIGPASRQEIWSRHVADSLRLVPLLPANVTHAIDLGSGAGLPGLVLAIATGLHVDLIEADRRKASFLAEAARATNDNVDVHAVRIDECTCQPAKLIVSRALAPLPRLLQLASPLLQPDGLCLFHKGRNVETEIASARKHWRMTTEIFPSGTDPSSVILRVSRIAHV